MSILDDAIKEHLELKRQHGADASELKQLEDEAFGAAERPGGEGSAADPLAEAPTQFMTQPDAEQAPEVPEAEAPPEAASPPLEEESSRRAPRSEIADLQEAPPAEEESPAMEHEAVPEPPAPPEPEISTGPTTEEREAIAEQPTEMYDIEEELSESQAEAPSEEELLEEGIEEPRLAPVDPLAGLDEAEAAGEVDVREAGDAETEAEEEYEEDDDFWDEKRLSDELDQALEAPVEDEDDGDPAIQLHKDAAVENDQVEEDAEEPAPSHAEEDVLEETPDFLEETPEDDQLWFEQKPPKDFDFDD
jgi:hypothetical protein